MTKLDACDASCRFEQSHRVIAMKMQFGTDAYCTANALGGAIGTAAKSPFQTRLDDNVKDGSVSSLFTFDGDLAGASGAVTVGNLAGAPTSNAPPYSGTSDLDWWYAPTPSTIDATRTPRATLTGAYTGGVLDATGRLNFVTSIGGAVTNLAVSSAKLKMSIGAANVPTVAAAEAPPGHVAAERLLPTLQSFASGGGAVDSPTGQLCGNIAAASLDTAAPPPALLPGGATACRENYSAANRLLDILVGGCTVKVSVLTVTVIKKTQPDQADPAAAVAGAGAPYMLSADPTTKRVNSCRDKAGDVVPLQACLNAAAYSMSFKVATDRVIIR